MNSTNKSEKQFVELIYLSLSDYEIGLDRQVELKKLVQTHSDSIYILGLEHKAVLTLGYRADQSEEVISTNIIPIIKTARGGLATIHSEGQLVIYPVLCLRSHNLGVRSYVQLLLDTTKDLLNLYKIESSRDEKGIGLFTKNGKIAFCGIQIKNGISQHGISLNVKNDLNLFKYIVPCGVVEQQMDSMAAYTAELELAKIFSEWANIFTFKINKFKN